METIAHVAHMNRGARESGARIGSGCWSCEVEQIRSLLVPSAATDQSDCCVSHRSLPPDRVDAQMLVLFSDNTALATATGMNQMKRKTEMKRKKKWRAFSTDSDGTVKNLASPCSMTHGSNFVCNSRNKCLTFSSTCVLSGSFRSLDFRPWQNV